MPELDGEKIMENIEKYGNADGDPSAPPAELAPETSSPEAKAQAQAAAFSFATQDDLLKHEVEYAWNGKQIKEPLSVVLQRAGKGYDYAQQMNRLNTERSEWETKVKTAEELHGKWSRFDEYAKQNPAWYQHWENAWQNRSQNLAEPGQSDGNLDAKLNALLEERLKPVNELLTHHEQQKLREKVEGEDKALEHDIKSIRESHPDLDFDATDPESGKSLEYKVLEYMSKEGIRSFNSAFKAFYHDELVKRAREQAKDEQSKAKIAQTKAGIIEPQRSTSGSRPAPNLRALSWDQTNELAMRELGITK